MYAFLPPPKRGKDPPSESPQVRRRPSRDSPSPPAAAEPRRRGERKEPLTPVDSQRSIASPPRSIGFNIEWSRGLPGEPLDDGELLNPLDECYALYPEEEEYYPAVILRRLPDARYLLFYKGWENEEYVVSASQLRKHFTDASFAADEEDSDPEDAGEEEEAKEQEEEEEGEVDPLAAAANPATAATAGEEGAEQPQNDGAEGHPDAAWEQHTTGFGSRMLELLGWKPGEGLGKERMGRTSAIRPRIIPQNVGLDFISQPLKNLRKKKDSPDPQKGEKAKRRKAASARPDVFSFINRKLGGGGYNSSSSRPGPSASHPSDRDRLSKAVSQMTPAELRRDLLAQQQRLHRYNARVKRLQASLERNRNHPGFRRQLSVCQEVIRGIQQRMHRVQRSLANQGPSRKSKIF